MNPSTNPFEALPDETMLHILSYLPRKDLLKLTLVDKRFNLIITESKETMAKIPLVLDVVSHSNSYGTAVELARKRKFRALQLNGVYWSTEKDLAAEVTPLLEHLSGSVEHLEIHYSNFIHSFSFKSVGHMLLQMSQIFLPKLKTCVFDYLEYGDLSMIINDEATSKHPLKSLRVYESDMIKFFSGCTQLKSFQFEKKNGTTDSVYDFLAKQTHLEKLKFGGHGVDLSRMVLVQLKELSLTKADESEISEYLEKLPNLTKLHIEISDTRYHRRIVTTICNASSLEDLNITVGRWVGDNPFEQLENHTVKKLRISHAHDDVTAWLLQIFHGTVSVSLKLYKGGFDFGSDLNNLPHETIDKIGFEPVTQPINFTFGSRLVPTNVRIFESAVMKLAEKFSARIRSIIIGHDNWRDNRDFKLSNSFCEGIVNTLPNLTELELYNVADCHDFSHFLYLNRNALKNLTIKLRIPNDKDEPKWKKMRIEID